MCLETEHVSRSLREREDMLVSCPYRYTEQSYEFSQAFCFCRKNMPPATAINLMSSEINHLHLQHSYKTAEKMT